jgi:cell wall-associated NlpC family hydrolase
MKTIIIIIIILSGLATFLASGQEKREFRPLIPGKFTSSEIIASAKKWSGRHYRYGQSRQCANWVGHVIKDSGGIPPYGHSMARNWLEWGRPVLAVAIRPGDVVITWRGSRSGTAGHILIYIGDGQCIHRPTRSKAVCKTPLSLYKSKILGVRRK